MNEIQLPHNVEAEMGLIACSLLDRPTLVEAIDLGITHEAFFREANSIIFKALMELSLEDDEELHEIKLLDKLAANGQEAEAGGIAYIYEIQKMVETPVHAKYFARQVINTWNQRKLMRSCRMAIEKCSQRSTDLAEITNTLEIDVKRINDSLVSKSDLVEVSEVAGELEKNLLDRSENPEKWKAKVTTPLLDLNKILSGGGFLPGQLVVLAARPSVGKTSLAINIAETAAVNNNVLGLIFSFEMSPQELAYRMACSRSQINAKHLEDGFLGQEAVRRFHKNLKEIREAPLWFNKKDSSDILRLCASSRLRANQAERSGNKLGFIVIDYLQLIEGTNKNIHREQQIAEMSRKLKQLARELEVPIIALSQLNREGEKTGREPRLSDLRESGSIEQDADIVLLLHRPDQSKYNNGVFPDPNVEVIQILHAKVRSGPIGMIETIFRRNCTRFENYKQL